MEKELGGKVRKLRGKLTQREFGDYFGVSHAAVSDWEREVSDTPKQVTLALLDAAYNEGFEAGTKIKSKETWTTPDLIKFFDDNGLPGLAGAVRALARAEEEGGKS